MPEQSRFSLKVEDLASAGQVALQPRMGFGSTAKMRAGLEATRDSVPTAVGTITVDSFTRTSDWSGMQNFRQSGGNLNGYPIVTSSTSATIEVLGGLDLTEFPVQVRHGSASPRGILEATCAAGLDASEGGPISYCLPYSALSVRESTDNWLRALEVVAVKSKRQFHLETFGGCMLGQLCPPSMLIACSLLEGMFFAQFGMVDVSLSYAQQSNAVQDAAALKVLQEKATKLLAAVRWHTVLYTHMGLYPETPAGAIGILRDSAHLARHAGVSRLIVKTNKESRRIPDVSDNVAALRCAYDFTRDGLSERWDSQEVEMHAASLSKEVDQIINSVLDIDDDLSHSLPIAVELGLIDIPFCRHPDNLGLTMTRLGPDGSLEWASTGRTAIEPEVPPKRRASNVSANELLNMLRFVRDKYDNETMQQT